MTGRLSLGIGLLFSWLLGPWWLVLALAIVGLAWYDFYPEALVASLLLDFQGSGSSNLFGHPLGLSLVITVFLFLIPIVRSRLYTR